MRNIISVLAVIIMLFLPSCDLDLLDGAESSLNPPHEILDPPEGLTGYRIVDVDDVVEEGRQVSLPSDFRDKNDIELLTALISNFTDLFGANHFAELLEALGIDMDNVFSGPDIFPSSRSIITENRLNIAEEGVVLTDNYETKLEAYVDYLDLILNADSPAFMRFLFNAVDGYKWNYSPSNASMNGKLGLSGLVNMESSLEDAALSAYMDLEFYDVQIGSFDFEFNGTPLTVYFPDTGTLHLEAQASFANNRIRYVIDDTTSVGGLDRPDGSGQVIYGDAYCPFLVTLVVRETAYFDAKVLFDAIRRLAVSSSLTGEAVWNTLETYLWPDSSGPNITITFHIPDMGDGTSRTVSASDWTFFQFLF